MESEETPGASDYCILKPEQDQAVKAILAKKDVLAVLPTGFGKSVIFQEFTRRKMIECDGCVVVLVISPLNSIIEDQLAKLNYLGLPTSDLSTLNIEDVKACQFKALLSLPERVLNREFKNVLKYGSSKLHNFLSCTVVDESHTVDTWTDKR